MIPKINFPVAPSFNNEGAHKTLKQIMHQRKNLSIVLDDEQSAWISCKSIAKFRYKLSMNGWNWIIRYLTTGDYEDLGVHPEDTTAFIKETPNDLLTKLIEKGANVARVPFLRETQAHIRLIGIFTFGKVFFNIKRTDEFIEQLNTWKL